MAAEIARQGIQVTKEGAARARAARAAIDAEWPPERYQAVRERVRRAEVLAAFTTAPVLDAARLRADLDAVIDQDLSNREW